MDRIKGVPLEQIEQKLAGPGSGAEPLMPNDGSTIGLIRRWLLSAATSQQAMKRATSSCRRTG